MLAAGGLAGLSIVRGQAPNSGAPFALDKPASADLTITMKKGTTIQAKVYLETDKLRADLTTNGMQVTTIIRKDQQKIYELLAGQKMAMEMPYDANKFKNYSAVDSAFASGGNFTLIGPDTIDGIACLKYKVTSDKTKQVFYFWMDAAKKVPVELDSDSGSLKVKWRNYQAGPQDASLFEVPAGYQMMEMPEMPGAEGGD